MGAVSFNHCVTAPVLDEMTMGLDNINYDSIHDI